LKWRLARILGEGVAKLIQLMMEYDPQPPFHAGTPETAGAALVQQAMKMCKHRSVNIENTSHDGGSLGGVNVRLDMEWCGQSRLQLDAEPGLLPRWNRVARGVPCG
jgi:hypothetical protein